MRLPRCADSVEPRRFVIRCNGAAPAAYFVCVDAVVDSPLEVVQQIVSRGAQHDGADGARRAILSEHRAVVAANLRRTKTGTCEKPCRAR